MSTWIKIKGTQTGSFQLGLTGPVLNNNSGNLQLRNSANTANADISVGNVTAGNTSAQNILIGSGSPQSGNILTVVGNAYINNNITATSVTGTLTTAAQPNITSVGTLTSLSIGNGGAVSGQGYTLYANGTTMFANSVTTSYLTGTLTANANSQPNITSVGTLSSLRVSGTSNVGNLTINGLVDFSSSVGVMGNIVPISNVTYSLGSSTNRFKDLWLSGNTIQLGDSTISTSGNGLALPSANVTTDLSVGGNAVIAGNLTVAGTTTYVNSTNTSIADPIIELGGGANGAALLTSDGLDRGTLLHYAAGNTARDAFMGWKSSTSDFIFASNATVSNNVVTINTLGNIRANYIVGTFAANSGAQPNITQVGTLISGLTVAGSGIFVTGGGGISGTGFSIASGLGTFTGLTANMGTVNFTNTTNVSLGAVGNLRITGGSNGQVLTTNGSGNLSWSTVSGGGNSSYGDSNVTSLLTSGDIIGNIVFGNNTGTYANIELRGVYSKISAPYALFGYEVGTRSINSSSVGNDANLELKSAANVNIQVFTGNAYTNIISVVGDYPNYASAPRVAIAGNVAITGNISATNLGNIVTISKDGNASNVLYGNGVFAAAPTGGGNVATDYWRTTSKTLTYSSGSQVALLTVPANATVDKVTVIVDTAFNGNSPGATVGRSFGGTGLEYVSTGDVDLKTADRYDLPCQIAPTGNTFDVVINYTASSSTAGSARVLITYAVAS